MTDLIDCSEVKQQYKICVMGAASSPHVLARARIFAHIGYDVELISPTASPNDKLLKTFCTDYGGSLIGKLKGLFATLKLLVCARADLYHAHYAAEYGTWLAALLCKRPFVITVMGGDVLFDEQGSLGWLGRWLTGFSLRRADLVTAKSRSLAKRLVEMGVAEDKIEIVYWGVEPEIFSYTASGRTRQRDEWNIKDDAEVIYCPRMLQPLYNQHLLVEAFPKILEEIPNAVLILSTMGEILEYGQKVRAQVEQLKLKSVVLFIPGSQREEMASVYSSADLIVAIPSSDGMPQSTLEAMACERPVLMSNLERYKELFTHKESAWFCDLSASELSTAISGLLKNHKSAALIAEKGQAIIAEKANFNNEARRVEKFYLTLMEGRAK